MATATIEVWTVVDESGNYACGSSKADAEERYADEVSPNELARAICCTLEVELPCPVILTASVPLTGQGARLAVKA